MRVKIEKAFSCFFLFEDNFRENISKKPIK